MYAWRTAEMMRWNLAETEDGYAHSLCIIHNVHDDDLREIIRGAMRGVRRWDDTAAARNVALAAGEEQTRRNQERANGGQSSDR